MSPAARSRGAAAFVVVAIVLFAFSLRSAVASLSPIVERIGDDFSLPAWIVGLIGTAPPVCYAVLGLLTPVLERRFGLRLLVPLALAVVTVGLAGRAFASDAGLLLAATVLVFAGVGVGNVLLPPLVKRFFPDRIGAMTTVFTTTMAVASFVPPLVAVPVAESTGWRWSLGLWAVFALLALLPWLALARRAPSAAAVAGEARSSVWGRMWGLPVTWALIGGFAVTSGTAYTGFAWLPQILTDVAGVSPVEAGALLSLFGFMGLPCAIIVPLVVTKFERGVGVLFGVAVASGLIGVAGLLWAPTVATWLWVVLLGICPLLFPLVFVLLNLRTRTHEAAVALSGVVQGVGYGIAALFPFGVGIAHTLTGGWTAPLIMLAALALVGVPAGAVAVRRTSVEEQWESRRGRPW